MNIREMEVIVDGLRAVVLETGASDQVTYYVAIANCGNRQYATDLAEQVNQMFAQIAEGEIDG